MPTTPPQNALVTVRAVRKSLAKLVQLTHPEVGKRLSEAVQALYALENVPAEDAIGFVEEALAILEGVEAPDTGDVSTKLNSNVAILRMWCRDNRARQAGHSAAPIPLGKH